MPTNDEVIEVARSVSAQHTPEEIALAGWLHVSDQVFSRSCMQHEGAHLPMIEMRDRCVKAFLVLNGINEERLQSARRAIERADRTLRYLGSIPK